MEKNYCKKKKSNWEPTS